MTDVNAFHEQLELAFLEENWGTSGYEQVGDGRTRHGHTHSAAATKHVQCS